MFVGAFFLKICRDGAILLAKGVNTILSREISENLEDLFILKKKQSDNLLVLLFYGSAFRIVLSSS